MSMDHGILKTKEQKIQEGRDEVHWIPKQSALRRWQTGNMSRPVIMFHRGGLECGGRNNVQRRPLVSNKSGQNISLSFGAARVWGEMLYHKCNRVTAMVVHTYPLMFGFHRFSLLASPRCEFSSYVFNENSAVVGYIPAKNHLWQLLTLSWIFTAPVKIVCLMGSYRMPETTICNLCGSNEAFLRHGYKRFLDLEDPFNICECQHCGLIYMSPRPSPAELIEMYANEPYFSKQNANRGASRIEFYTSRMRRLEKFNPQRGRLLGIGCLEGGYALEIAQNRGWDVLGIESSKILSSYARENLAINVETVDGWDLSKVPSDSFDAVYTHSFEHFSDPRSVLKQMFRALKPEGTLMIEAPNQIYSLKDKVRRVLMFALGRYRELVFRKPPPLHFHLYYFGSHTLRTMIESEGFKLRELRTYIPRHPVYLCNPKGKWVQELLYMVGGFFGSGPSIEVIATKSR